MLRPVVGVIVGYLLIFILVIVVFTGLYLLMGADWSFKPGSYEASNAWNAISMVAYLVIAIIGGLVCALIAKGGKAPLALAIVVLALGLLLAIPSVVANRAPDAVRTGNVSNMEAMQKAKQPLWLPFALPIIGAIGVLIGGKLKRSS